MTLRSTGLSHDEIITTLQQMKDNDVRWRDGRAFTLAYSAGDEVLAVAEEAYRAFASENALNTDAFPSLRVIQAQVVEIVIDWLQGDSSAAGFMTSGGTESILLAVKASRERGKKERGITQPNVVLPTSAHAAFEKACYYFGLESRRVAVSEDWRANPEAMAAAVDDLVAHPLQQCDEAQTRGHSPMIATNCNPHEILRACPREDDWWKKQTDSQ